MDLFFCPVCGRRHCKAIGTVCSDCRIQSIAQRSNRSGDLIPGRCFYCDRETFVGNEHVVPLARGGPHESWNIEKACLLCNGDKSDQLPSEWCPTHEEALTIERRVPTIFPRMRHGRIIGDHADGYARIRSLCANFIYTLHTEIRGLPKRKLNQAVTAWRAVEKLQRHVNDVIVNAEAKGENVERKVEFRNQVVSNPP
jgi:hypothetical protein